MVTNTPKHAQASAVNVDVTSANGVLRMVARDDGIGGGSDGVGGADPARGSGLVGLRDRIETLGGTIVVRSPREEGTRVEVALPLDGDRQAIDNPHTLIESSSSRQRPLGASCCRDLTTPTIISVA